MLLLIQAKWLCFSWQARLTYYWWRPDLQIGVVESLRSPPLYISAHRPTWRVWILHKASHCSQGFYHYMTLRLCKKLLLQHCTQQGDVSNESQLKTSEIVALIWHITGKSQTILCAVAPFGYYSTLLLVLLWIKKIPACWNVQMKSQVEITHHLIWTHCGFVYTWYILLTYSHIVYSQWVCCKNEFKGRNNIQKVNKEHKMWVSLTCL